MGDELVTEGAHLAVHDEALDVEMGIAELEKGLAWVRPKGGQG